MDSWITWIIQIVAYGLICFLLKRELHQMDEGNKRQDNRIEAVDKKATESISSLEEKLNTFISNMPFQYTLRDDFIRAVANMDNKLDKIIDQLNRKSG